MSKSLRGLESSKTDEATGHMAGQSWLARLGGWHLRLLFYPCLLVLVLLLADHWLQSLTYPIPPWTRTTEPPEPIRAIALASEPGQQLQAYFLPCPREVAPVVIFFHGGGQDLNNLVDSGFMQRFPDLGVHLLAIDYPGYGASSGSPSEASLALAADSAMDWAFANFPDAPKLIMGWALGAAVAVQTASRFEGQYDGLILVSAWTDLPSVVTPSLPNWLTALLLRERYDSAATVGELHTPSLVIHGKRDDLVPIEQGRHLAQLLGNRGSCQFVEVADHGHGDIMDASLTWLHLTHFFQAFARD